MKVSKTLVTDILYSSSCMVEQNISAGISIWDISFENAGWLYGI